MDAVVTFLFSFALCTWFACIIVIHRAPRASWRSRKVWQSCMWNMMWRAQPSYRRMNRMTVACGTVPIFWIHLAPGLKMPTKQISREGPWHTVCQSERQQLAVNGRHRGLWHSDVLSFAPQTDFWQEIKLPRTHASYRYSKQNGRTWSAFPKPGNKVRVVFAASLTICHFTLALIHSAGNSGFLQENSRKLWTKGGVGRSDHIALKHGMRLVKLVLSQPGSCDCERAKSDQGRRVWLFLVRQIRPTLSNIVQQSLSILLHRIPQTVLRSSFLKVFLSDIARELLKPTPQLRGIRWKDVHQEWQQCQVCSGCEDFLLSEVVNLNTGKLLFSKLQTGSSLVYEAGRWMTMNIT